MLEQKQTNFRKYVTAIKWSCVVPHSELVTGAVTHISEKILFRISRADTFNTSLRPILLSLHTAEFDIQFFVKCHHIELRGF